VCESLVRACIGQVKLHTFRLPPPPPPLSPRRGSRIGAGRWGGGESRLRPSTTPRSGLKRLSLRPVLLLADRRCSAPRLFRMGAEMSEGPRNHSFFQNYSADRLDGLVAASWTPAAPIRANAAHCGGSGGAASFLTQRPSRSMSRSGHCPLLSLSLSLSFTGSRSLDLCMRERPTRGARRFLRGATTASSCPLYPKSAHLKGCEGRRSAKTALSPLKTLLLCIYVSYRSEG
jgi:hypothetical protein